MIKKKNHKQYDIFDPWGHITPKRRQSLSNSWAELFREELLLELPVETVKPYFKEGFGRPTKDVYTMLGVVFFQQYFDLSDEQTCDNLAFNIQWHYALNITEESDYAKYLAPKTLWNWRSIVVDNDIDDLIFDSITKKLAEYFDVDPGKQRLDSVHIKSNMQRLGRIRLFSKTMNRFLVNLNRNHKDQFRTVSDDVIERYFPQKSLNAFSLVKPSESSKTLDNLASDLYNLTQRFKGCSEITSMNSYKKLLRILKEQCIIKESKTGVEIEVKKSKDIPSDSLQNPSDPDATYSGHKGQGYQAQIMETYSTEENKDEEKDKPNIITYVNVEQAHESDADALIPAIKDTQDKNLGPNEIQCDSLYGSDDNFQKAKGMGVDIISPTMPGRKGSKVSLSEFKISDDGSVFSCPKEQKPIAIKRKKTRHTAIFDSTICDNCPLKDNCRVKKTKKNHILRYTDKEARIARRREFEKTDEFKEQYRWRAGVEATMSELDRKTGAKHLRVRGFKKVKFAVTLKAAGINMSRATAVLKARKKRSGSASDSILGYVKELCRVAIALFKGDVIFQRLKNELLAYESIGC